MKSIMKASVAAGILASVIMLFPSSAAAQIHGAIGVNFGFTGSYAAGNQLSLGLNDAAGVVAVSNWNNLLVSSPANANTTWSGLVDGAGTAISTTLTIAGVEDGWYQQSTTDTNCVNANLMYDFWKRTTTAASTVDDGISLSFANVTPGTYDVYVYLDNNTANGWGHVTADGGATRYYFNENTPYFTCSDGFYTGINTTGSGGYPNVDYIKIPGVVASGSLTVTLTFEGSTGGSSGGFGIAGIQLIPPAPVAIATSPADTTVYTNGVGIFSVTSTNGAAPLSYQWYVVNGGVTNAITDGTGNAATYDTPPATTRMNGDSYYAVVTDSLGNHATSATATLSVIPGSPDVISVQLEPDDSLGVNNGGQALALTDVTGAYAVSNWNAVVVAVDGSTQSFPGLKDETGVGTPVQLVTAGTSDGWRANAPAPDAAPITKLLNTFVKGKTGNPAALGAALMTFTLSGLDPSKTYDAYVYMLDNSGGNLPDVDGGTGVTNYAGSLFTSVSATSNFVASANQSPAGPRDQGNFVHLLGLRPDVSGAVTVSVAWDPASTGDGVGVCGLQLVNASLDLSPVSIISEPADQRVLTNTTASFGVGALGNPLFYQWYEVSGGATNAILNATNSTYTTAPVQDSDAGTGYFVVVYNQFNTNTSTTAFLSAAHIVSPVPGFLENDEFNTGAWSSTADALALIYPGSPWLLTNAPDIVEYLQTLDDHQDLAINSAERIYGYFVPPVTGNYIFYVASDDSAVLWLSTNNSPTNVYEIAQNQAWMYHNDWTLTQSCGETGFGGGGEYRSDQFELGGGQNNVVQITGVNGSVWAPWPGLNGDGSITLTAGTHYYLELDHWQGNGGQAASVTYKLAGQPDPTYGSPSLLAGDNVAAVQAQDGDVVVISNQPVDVTVQEGFPATFSVAATAYAIGNPAAAPPIEYQWFRISGGVTNAIAGAQNSTYSNPPEAIGNSGQQYYCQITTLAYQTNSSAATLTVVPNTTKPAIVAIGGTATNLFVTWNELLDSASAVNPANYSLNDGLTVLAATSTNIVSGSYAATAVTLNLSGAVVGQEYTLTANNIKNQSNSETNALDTQAAFVAYNTYLDFNEGVATDTYGLASLNPIGGFDGAGAVDLSIPSGGQGWVLVNDPINGVPVTNFIATFKLYIGPFPNNNDNNPTGLGDGISFNFGDSGSVYWPNAPTLGNLSDGISGADVLSVNFKPYLGSTLLGVNVSYGGVVLTNVPMTQAEVVNSRWVDITIQLNADGTVSVDRDGHALVSGLSLPGYTQVSGGTFLVGASCGGYWEEQNVDKIAILENAPLPPAAISVSHSGANLNMSWIPDGGRLLETSVLNAAAWTEVGGSQMITVPIGSTNRFFRVVVP